jgi:hypothetical protein
LFIGGSPVQGRYPASKANDGICPEKQVHLTMPYTSSEERKRWSPPYLAIYNGRRYHMALASRIPFQQLNWL